MKYTIKQQPNDQDNINFIDFKIGGNTPDFLDYNEVLQYSLENNFISSTENIKSLCDGSNHVEPYFSENMASVECEQFLWQYDKGFDPLIKIYEIF